MPPLDISAITICGALRAALLSEIFCYRFFDDLRLRDALGGALGLERFGHLLRYISRNSVIGLVYIPFLTAVDVVVFRFVSGITFSSL